MPVTGFRCSLLSGTCIGPAGRHTEWRCGCGVRQGVACGAGISRPWWMFLEVHNVPLLFVHLPSCCCFGSLSHCFYSTSRKVSAETVHSFHSLLTTYCALHSLWQLARCKLCLANKLLPLCNIISSPLRVWVSDYCSLALTLVCFPGKSTNLALNTSSGCLSTTRWMNLRVCLLK